MPYHTNMERMPTQRHRRNAPRCAPETGCALWQEQAYGCGLTPSPCMEAPCVADPKNGVLLGDLPLVMAYVPSQSWRQLYDEAKALKAGTLFQELDLPFMGGAGREGCCCGR